MIEYSRIPVRVFRALVNIVANVDAILRNLNVDTALIISNNGIPVDKLSIVSNEVLVIVPFHRHMLESLRNLPFKHFKAIEVKSLGIESLRYEAVATLYALLSRDEGPYNEYAKHDMIGKVGISELIYLGRKILESIENFDNNYVVSCSASIAILNKVLKRYDLKAELHRCTIEIQPLGRMLQEIDIAIYKTLRNGMRYVCNTKILFDGERILLPIPTDNECHNFVKLRIDITHRCLEIRGRCVDVGLASDTVDYNLFWHIASSVHD